MRIQHNSPHKIKEVEDYHNEWLRGCLCFSGEGHEYSLSVCDDEYAYIIEVEKVLDMNRTWYEHELTEVSDLIEELSEELELDSEEVCDLLDNSEHLCDERGWLVQQYQGKVAHDLGYDCAKSEDEQGVVYIAYCVDRKMKEVKK